MNLKELFPTLKEDEHGILHSPEKITVSFPKEGNETCFGLEDRSFWFRHRNEVLIAAIKRFTPPAGPMLDIGGGNGFVTRRLLDEGFPAILLEPGEVGAFNAKVRRGLPWVACSTLEQSNIPDESVGSVGCFDVLEHIQDDAAFIQNVARIMKPGGILYLAVPAGQWLWSNMDDYSGHYRRYDRRSLVAVLDGAFEPLYFTHFFGWLTLPLFLLKSLPSRLGLMKRENIFSHETEHGTDNSRLSSIMSFLLKNEVEMIRKGKSKNWGTSCLVVGRKVGFRS